jgi:hypothetical protein
MRFLRAGPRSRLRGWNSSDCEDMLDERGFAGGRCCLAITTDVTPARNSGRMAALKVKRERKGRHSP